jgi:hypothetical protein
MDGDGQLRPNGVICCCHRIEQNHPEARPKSHLWLLMGTSSGPMSTCVPDENMRRMRAGSHTIPVEQRPSVPDGVTSGAGPSSDLRHRTSQAASEWTLKARKHILERGAERHKSRDKKRKEIKVLRWCCLRGTKWEKISPPPPPQFVGGSIIKEIL